MNLIKQALIDACNALTPAERERFARITDAEWLTAIGECVRDRDFWNDLVTTFVTAFRAGMEAELEKTANDY